MNIQDIIIIAVLAAAVIAAAVFIVRRRKKGKCLGCGGDCSSCAGCNQSENKK